MVNLGLSYYFNKGKPSTTRKNGLDSAAFQADNRVQDDFWSLYAKGGAMQIYLFYQISEVNES